MTTQCNSKKTVDKNLLVRFSKGLSALGIKARQVLASRSFGNQGKSNEEVSAETDRLIRTIIKTLSPDGKNAYQLIVKGAEPLVSILAAKYRPFCRCEDEFNDLKQEGYQGVISALARYDFEKGERFETFAEYSIERAFKAFTEENKHLIRPSFGTTVLQRKYRQFVREFRHDEDREPSIAEAADALGITFENACRIHDSVRVESSDAVKDGVEFEDTSESSEDILVRTQRDNQVREAVSDMGEKTADALRLRHEEGLTYREIGQRLGISTQGAKKRVEQGEMRLRKQFASQHANGAL